MNKKTLAAILAHPDDESFPIGGTLARYAQEGVDVHLIVATLGEAGIAGKSATEAAAIRRTELQRAGNELGVKRIHYLEFQDGRLAHTRDAEGHARLEAAFRQITPDVVITFGPDGISGHPDHVTVSRWATAVFDKLSQEETGPDRLYYIAPSEATQQGCGVAPPDEAVGRPVAFIDIGNYLEQKVRAAQQHASQNPPFSGAPEEEAKELACHELFRLARPWKAANGADPEVDLFAALT
ncbi:MAG: PIG-L deacetylase family protein [Chloroflexota bacterium]